MDHQDAVFLFGAIGAVCALSAAVVTFASRKYSAGKVEGMVQANLGDVVEDVSDLKRWRESHSSWGQDKEREIVGNVSMIREQQMKNFEQIKATSENVLRVGGQVEAVVIALSALGEKLATLTGRFDTYLEMENGKRGRRRRA